MCLQQVLSVLMGDDNTHRATARRLQRMTSSWSAVFPRSRSRRAPTTAAVSSSALCAEGGGGPNQGDMVSVGSRSSKQQTKEFAIHEHTPMYMPLNLEYPGLRVLNEKPPIFFVDNFLSEEECEQLITTASPLLQRSKTHAIAGAPLDS